MFHRFTFSRCVRVFVATFVLACLFQFILIGLFGAFPNKFDFYHAIIQKQRTNVPTQAHQTNEQLIASYFRNKRNELKLLEEEQRFMAAYYEAKAAKANQSIILNYNWTLDRLPYFFGKRDGDLYPEAGDSTFASLAIWPEETYHDRIVNQLMYMPENYDRKALNERRKFKRILLHDNKGRFNAHEVPNGQAKFLADNCPVNTCEIVRDTSQAETVDAILFKEHIAELTHKRSPEQVWIYYNLESPSNIKIGSIAPDLINWTATYRLDSDLVTPYAKFVQYSDDLKFYSAPQKDYSAKKSRKAAWFVSNCGSSNRRNVYAKELKKYFDVDIYGRCGSLHCPKYKQPSCFLKLKNYYKFYLSFENSNCKDYITEKFYLNALQNYVVPIVLGPNHKDYLKQAPYFSYIHVDEFAGGVPELGRFLNLLNQNATLYNAYFRWLNTGEFINTLFWCRLCALLHSPLKPKTYKDLDKWWSSGTCENMKTFKYIKPSR